MAENPRWQRIQDGRESKMAENPRSPENPENPNASATLATSTNATNLPSPADEEINDRFTTHWSGPFHPDALEYAASHNISYDFLGQQIRSFRSGPEHPGGFMMLGGGGGTDLNALRTANLAHDEEFRQRARVDTDLHTGTAIVTFSWRTVTRGAKLRTSVQHRQDYGDGRDYHKEQLKILRLIDEACPDADPKKAVWGRRIEWTVLRISQLEEMLKLVDELEQLALDEAKPDWDWETGIDAQLKVRERQHAIRQEMEPEPNDGAAHLSIQRIE
ncbi:hypothetical protein ACEPPN_008435 [Leptodophora sp. 'Broadleaf-Isolate-01']